MWNEKTREEWHAIAEEHLTTQRNVFCHVVLTMQYPIPNQNSSLGAKHLEKIVSIQIFVSAIQVSSRHFKLADVSPWIQGCGKFEVDVCPQVGHALA